ncbi:MAG: DUF1707 domain-containing protein [Actinomycetota bacterium]|nr:DUF1707 domain-containing protein [Actinomycetota bacterium]
MNPSWLAATADRERTVGTLRAGFTEGRLGQDELDERTAQAYAARTYADLWALTADLPIGPYPFGYGPQVVAPPGAILAPNGAEASNWQSAAALLITALVIFTLAALVTAIVTAHVQPGLVSPAQQPAVFQPFQPVHLTPFDKPIGQHPIVGRAGGTH